MDLLERVGQYRAVFVRDLARETGDIHRLERDIVSLRRQDLLDLRTIRRVGDGICADIVALTPDGQSLLDEHRDPEHDVGQRYYGGWVKPAECWHDAALYHMVRDIAVEIEATGGAVTRVILDDELKGHAFRELHALRQRSDRDDAELHATVASAQRLTCDRDHFVFPDVQLEIEEADGRVTIRDLELVTEHYHRGHLSGKASAGFHMFGERASAGRRGGRPHDPRNLKKII